MLICECTVYSGHLVHSESPESLASTELNTSANRCVLDLAALDSSGRVRVNPQQRAQILCAFDASGLSARSFAKRYGLKYTTFTNWVSRRENTSAAKSAVAPGLSLVEAVVAVPEPSSAGITIECSGGFRIHLRDRGAQFQWQFTCVCCA